MPDNQPEPGSTVNPARKKRLLCIWAGLTALGIIGATTFVARAFLPGGDGIIASATSPDGTEMCVVQTYNGFWAEPYTVSFYYRKPGKPWGWFYYDHEDTRWFSGKIALSHEGKTAHIWHGEDEVALFDVPSESFTINRWKRTLSPAQEWMPADWKPEDAITTNRTKPKSPMAVGAPSNLPPVTN